MYPYTWVGLEACYVAGIPFFKNTIAGDLLYVALLFGAFEWRVRRIPALRLQTVIHQPNEAHGKDLSAL